MSGNLYLRGSLGDADYTETLTAVVDRLANMRLLRVHTMLMGDINVEASRAGDKVKCAVTDHLIRNCSMYRADLEGSLTDMPTHIPWQAGERQRHLDALAVDVRVRPRVVDQGIDLDISEPLIPMSDHRPLWVTFRTRMCKVPKAAPIIVLKVRTATAEHWGKSRQLLDDFTHQWLPQAKHRVATAANSNRQNLIESLANEVTSAMHKEYCGGI